MESPLQVLGIVLGAGVGFAGTVIGIMYLFRAYSFVVNCFIEGVKARFGNKKTRKKRGE